jgi:hypothetical protein
MTPKKLGTAILCSALLAAASLYGQASAPAVQPTDSAVSPTKDDVATLKQQLAEQQKEIDALKAAVEAQNKMMMMQRATNAAPASGSITPGTTTAHNTPDTFSLPSKSLGDVASTTPIIPPVAPIAAPPAAYSQKTTTGSNPCEGGPDTNAVPPYIRLGGVCITPVGFVDATFVGRDKNAASGIGSNFGSVPYNNTVNGNLSETRFSIQNSRIGFRIDGDWKGTHFIGYNEIDFLGTSGATNLNTTNGAVVPRMRLYWIDARHGGWEFLAGQSWSMLTPNRRGISPLPADIFYSQVMDVNYMAGLTWTRQPGVRVLYHFGDTLTWGLAAEEPDQYIGGSSGGSSIVLPAAFTALAGTQLDNATFSNPYAGPQLTPDFISKIAWDPAARFHAEVAGVLSTFKTINPNNLPLGQTFTKTGGGVLVSLNGEIFKGFRLITTNFWNDGDGRYLFGQAPDVVVNANGTLSLLHSGGTVDGFESRIGSKFLLFAYVGGIYVGRDVVIDTNGKPVGYGYTGSSNSQNRAIEELTFGFNQTIWADPRYGAINVIGQYEYLSREPWYVTNPSSAHDNTVFLDLRYTLPGSMPVF